MAMKELGVVVWCVVAARRRYIWGMYVKIAMVMLTACSCFDLLSWLEAFVSDDKTKQMAG
jgi:hypothetical protein